MATTTIATPLQFVEAYPVIEPHNDLFTLEIDSGGAMQRFILTRHAVTGLMHQCGRALAAEHQPCVIAPLRRAGREG